MDIRHYVKVSSCPNDARALPVSRSCFQVCCYTFVFQVKKIASATRADCQYIDGVVFRKNVAHKRMKMLIRNPKVLLLSSALESATFRSLFVHVCCMCYFVTDHIVFCFFSCSFQRVENRLASFDQLVKQEEEYIRIQIQKIVDLHPDVVIVGHPVSRMAQDLLLQAGLCLVLNVKSSLMDRLARCTHAAILSSPGIFQHANWCCCCYCLTHFGDPTLYWFFYCRSC